MKQFSSISVIVPAHNESKCIPELLRRLVPILEQTNMSYEIIFVDDASKDSTYEVVCGFNKSNSNIKCISFSRNMGHQAALLCGLRSANGDMVLTMDSDLQHPPELVPEMVEKLKEGWSVVNCARKTDKDIGLLKKLFSVSFYSVFNKLSPVKIVPNTSDFRLMDRKSLDALLSMKEVNKFFRGMVPYIGFKQFVLNFDCPERFAGSASYTFKKSLRLASDGLTSFSTVPLKIPFYIGGIFLLIAILYLLSSVILLFTGHGYLVPGWISLIVIQVMMFAFQLVFTGVLGVYVGKIYTEVKKRPEYFVDKSIGV